MQVDEELGRGEHEIQDQRAAGEGGAEYEGAQQPEQGVEGQREVEGEVQAARVGGGEGLGGFLVSVLGLVRTGEAGLAVNRLAGWC